MNFGSGDSKILYSLSAFKNAFTNPFLGLAATYSMPLSDASFLNSKPFWTVINEAAVTLFLSASHTSSKSGTRNDTSESCRKDDCGTSDCEEGSSRVRKASTSHKRT